MDPLIAKSVQKSHGLCVETRKTLLRTRRDIEAEWAFSSEWAASSPIPGKIETNSWHSGFDPKLLQDGKACQGFRAMSLKDFGQTLPTVRHS